MKILIPSQLPNDKDERKTRYAIHLLQLKELRQMSMLDDVIIGYNNYEDDEFVKGVKYIACDSGLTNILDELMKFAQSEYEDEFSLFLADNILFDRIDVFMIDIAMMYDDKFDILSIALPDRPSSGTYRLKETFILDSSIMLVRNRIEYPSYKTCTLNPDNPSIEFGLLCQLCDIRTYRMIGKGFLTPSQSEYYVIDSSELNLLVEGLEEDINKLRKTYKLEKGQTTLKGFEGSFII